MGSASLHSNIQKSKSKFNKKNFLKIWLIPNAGLDTSPNPEFNSSPGKTLLRLAEIWRMGLFHPIIEKYTFSTQLELSNKRTSQDIQWELRACHFVWMNCTKIRHYLCINSNPLARKTDDFFLNKQSFSKYRRASSACLLEERHKAPSYNNV